MPKVQSFEYEGVTHTYKPKTLRRSIQMKLANIANTDYEGDWGVEAYVQSIDGRPPVEADEDLQDEVYIHAVAYFTNRLTRMASMLSTQAS